MSWLDKKYINLVSSRLEKFKWKGNVANFRCPLCGDSQTNKNKTRGYIYEQKGTWWTHCHNCGEHMMFRTLLKRIDSRLFYEYTSEAIKEKYTKKEKETDFTTDTVKRLSVPEDVKSLRKLSKISALPESHPAKIFMANRGLSKKLEEIFRWSPAFKSFTNSILTGKFDAAGLKRDEGRIIIPFFNADGVFHAFQGRALGASQVRYISIVVNQDVPLIWGLDTINLTKPVNVFEGVLDAVFIGNSLAICGGNFYDLADVVPNKSTVTIIYDNEPRSIETKKKIKSAIEQGYRVVIWPAHLTSKDVNDMILNENLTSSGISDIISNNTFSGAMALVKLSEWSKR